MTNLEKYNEAFTTTFEIQEADLATLEYQGIPACKNAADNISGNSRFISV